MKMRKICKYDEKHWLMQDLNKNLILFNEETHLLHDLEMFMQPERSKREDRESGCGALNTMET